MPHALEDGDGLNSQIVAVGIKSIGEAEDTQIDVRTNNKTSLPPSTEVVIVR
ncbi:MAG: hypothetical protein QOC56_2345 [Alphaproteobacteria bacterium]|nr:hypothetical protein [Alphaproteobacteria bacterium]